MVELSKLSPGLLDSRLSPIRYQILPHAATRSSTNTATDATLISPPSRSQHYSPHRLIQVPFSPRTSLSAQVKAQQWQVSYRSTSARWVWAGTGVFQLAGKRWGLCACWLGISATLYCWHGRSVTLFTWRPWQFRASLVLQSALYCHACWTALTVQLRSFLDHPFCSMSPIILHLQVGRCRCIAVPVGMTTWMYACHPCWNPPGRSNRHSRLSWSAIVTVLFKPRQAWIHLELLSVRDALLQ